MQTLDKEAALRDHPLFAKRGEILRLLNLNAATEYRGSQFSTLASNRIEYARLQTVERETARPPNWAAMRELERQQRMIAFQAQRRRLTSTHPEPRHLDHEPDEDGLILNAAKDTSNESLGQTLLRGLASRDPHSFRLAGSVSDASAEQTVKVEGSPSVPLTEQKLNKRTTRDVRVKARVRRR